MNVKVIVSNDCAMFICPVVLQWYHLESFKKNFFKRWPIESLVFLHDFYTGQARLIWSHSSARISFELSGNSNWTKACNSNFHQKLRIRNYFELKLWIIIYFGLKLQIRTLFDLTLWITVRPTSN